MKASVVSGNHGGVEMAWDIERVVQHQVDLLGAQHDTRDTAKEAEHHQGQEHAGGTPDCPQGARLSQSNMPLT